ncbi:sensor histidine kinase [Paenibacillus senegalimassiliensis]|uniref:sensor histidine kinase n=1 Tax=Paenibacillus senegalimassiliensis TaxID=1737426 RepID=UPI00073F97CC|nr:sensor histidine kinase [Paenibacillus senegalimassiliensis]
MLNRIIRSTNNLKLKHKLLISYIVVVMIPVLIVGVGVTAYFRHQAMERAIAQATNNVEKVKTRTAMMLRVPSDISDMIMLDRELATAVKTEYPDVLELTKSYLNYDNFREFILQYREISGIRFYYDNPTLINNLEFIPINEGIEQATWFKQAMESKRIGWFYIDDAEEFPVKRLSLVRQISFEGTRKSGVLMVIINQEELNRMLQQEPFETLITDDMGVVVAAKNPSLVGKTLGELDYGIDLSTQQKETLQVESQGEPAYLVIDTLTPDSSMNGLRFISVFTTESIVKDANAVSLMGLFIILLVLLLAFIFVYTVSFLTTNRLLRLSRHLNRLALGDLTVVSRIDGQDEIGQLSRQFNYMVESIRRLMDQVVEKTEQNNSLELAQREIKLKMMASQINPHFLFNALESIRMNAHLKGDQEIANVVRRLGKMMRKSLEVGRENIMLKEELEMVSSYLEIQKFRYENRLKYEIDVDPSVMNFRIPPLIIQPLVENAVVHGVENKEDGVKVVVSIRRLEEMLEVSVKDNGMGMTPERLEEVRESIMASEESEKNRIGLRNVYQRLVLTYGEKHGLNMDSRYGEGTLIIFTLPLNL